MAHSPKAGCLGMYPLCVFHDWLMEPFMSVETTKPQSLPVLQVPSNLW